MSGIELTNMAIRTGLVRQPGIGYFIACDPQKEASEPHAKLCKYSNGQITSSDVPFNAHSICLVSKPEMALVFVDSEGIFAIHTATSSHADNIFNASHPPPATPRYGSVRSVAQIDGRAHAVGHGGMVYRMDAFSSWTRIDEGLPEILNVTAIDGKSETDCCAVGHKGGVWLLDEQHWLGQDCPTNQHLSCVTYADEQSIYIGGYSGTLLHLKSGEWTDYSTPEFTQNIWGLAWFADRLYISTMLGLYVLDGTRFKPVDFNGLSPNSFYKLSTSDDVLWSIGEHEIFEWDGNTWSRIVTIKVTED